MPDVAELGRLVKKKYPQYANIDDAELGRRVRAKYPAYANFTDAPPPAQEPEGALSSFQTNLAGPLLRNVLNTAADIYNRPGETLERAGRAGLEFLSAFDPAGNAYQPTVASQEPRLQELRARAAAERPEALKLMESGLQQYEARPRTRAGKVAGVTGRILGEVAFPTAPESAVANIITAPFAGAAIRTAGQVVRPILSRIRGGVAAAERIEAKAAAQAAKEAPVIESAAAKATTEGTGPAATQGASAVTQPVDALQSAFTKLGTDSPDDISAMIFNANRRFNTPKSITPEERAAAIQDFNKVVQLTPAEENALAQVLPEYSFNPVRPGHTEIGGPYERNISDIPAAEPSAQLDANLRQLEQFFGAEGRAVQPSVVDAISAARRTPTSPVLLSDVREQLPGLTKSQFDAEVKAAAENGEIFIHRHDAPGQLSATEKSGMVKIGDEYYGAATVSGPKVGAGMDLNAAVTQAAKEVPQGIATRAKNEFLGSLGASKSLRSWGDISAVLRQGAVLFLRPFQWRQGQKALSQMFRAFKTKNYDDIAQAIEAHPDAALMDDAGLFLATRTKEGVSAGEEAFLKRNGSWISEKVSNAPGVKQSDQMYKSFLDTQRVEAFQQYKRLVEKAGLSPEQAEIAYKAAARWINVATGRGSLGQKLEKAMDALNLAFFSPRYIASRLNILNPGMYIKNAMTPGGRVVLRQQMADLAQFTGVALSTLYAAKAAGAEVNFDPDSSDFLKVKIGNRRYDMFAGLSQVVRLYWRVGAAGWRAARKEKPEYRQTATDIAETFLSYKLSPPAGVLRDFFRGETMRGKPFTYTRAAADLVAPMQWADFVDSFVEEGLSGVAMDVIGTTGIGVQNYTTPGKVTLSPAIQDKLEQRGIDFSNIKELPGDTDATRAARAQRVQDWLNTYTPKLMDNPRFQRLTPEQQDAAIKNLHRRIMGEANEKRPHISSFNPVAVIGSTIQAERNAPRRNRTKIVAPAQ